MTPAKWHDGASISEGVNIAPMAGVAATRQMVCLDLQAAQDRDRAMHQLSVAQAHRAIGEN
jgi:hypothetical protein